MVGLAQQVALACTDSVYFIHISFKFDKALSRINAVLYVIHTPPSPPNDADTIICIICGTYI